MNTKIKNTIYRLLLGLFVIGSAVSTYAFTQVKSEAATHYWYVKNLTTGDWESQGSAPTNPPLGACPEEVGDPCAKGFSEPQNPSEINDNTPAEEELFRSEQ